MNQEHLSSTEKMIIGATAWTTIKPLPRTLFGVATVSMDNKVFLTGKFGGVMGHNYYIVYYRRNSTRYF